jgi:hypothetical protein
MTFLIDNAESRFHSKESMMVLTFPTKYLSQRIFFHVFDGRFQWKTKNIYILRAAQ